MTESTGLAPVYRYFTADLLTNEVLAEIPFGGVSYERAIKGAGAFSGKIPVTEGTKSQGLYDNTLPGKTALYVVRNGICVWGGIVWSRTYDVVSRVLTVNASEFTSYFYHRRIWKTWSHQYGATVEVLDGFAKVTLDFGSETSALTAQSSVKLEFQPKDSRYDNFYTVAGSPTPTKDEFYISPMEQTRVITQAKIEDGVATIYTSEPHGFSIGDSIFIDCGAGSIYNGTHVITAVTGPKLDRFTYAESDATRELEFIDGTAKRTVADGTYTGVTVSVRADTYDYIRSLVGAVFNDFVGLDFPNTYIEPGVSFDFNVIEREVAEGLATITTDEPHNLAIGQAVQIDNLDNLWDGEYIVTETPTDETFRFELGGFLESEPVTVNDHEIASLTAVSGIVAITTTEPHDFQVGQDVEIVSGITSGGLGPYLNGTYRITEIPTATTFKYATGSLVNVEETSLVPATATSASDINYFPNPSFEGVVSGSFPLRANLVPWSTIFGNSSFFTFNPGTGGTGAVSYVENFDYPSFYAIRYTVSIPPTANGTYLSTNSNAVSSFPARVGAKYTASAYIYSSFATTAYLSIPWRNSANTNFASSDGTSVSVPANTLVRLSVTATAPANSVVGGVRMYVNATEAPSGGYFEMTSHMVEQSDQLRDYFDGSLPNTYGYDYNWVGPALRSPSVAVGQPVPVRINLSPNPSASALPGTVTTGLNPWITVTQSTARSYSAPYSFLCTHSAVGGTGVIGLKQAISVQAGVTYAMNARVYFPSTNIGTPSGNGRLEFGTETSDFIYVPAEDTWIRVSGTVTVSLSGAITASLVLFPSGSWGANDVVYIDDIVIEASTTINPFFDGDTFASGDFVYAWAGVPGNSISYQYAPSVFSVNTTNCMAYQSVEWTSSGSKSMRITPTNSVSNDSYAVGWDMPFTPGKTYTVKAKIRIEGPLLGTLNSNSRRIVIRKNGTTVLARSDASPNFEAVREAQVVFTAPADATSIRIDLYNGASKGNGDVWWDDLIVVEGGGTEFEINYFDGDTAPNGYFTYEWAGVPHLSESERRITTPISQSELTSNVVTLATAIPHNYDIGREVVIQGVTPEIEIIEKAFDAVSSKATITTAEAHQFEVGEVVQISGLRDSSDISKRVVTGNTVTMTTRLAHNFAQGEEVTISDLRDISYLTKKKVQNNVVTMTVEKPHNIYVGDEVTVSDLNDIYVITNKRLDDNIARLTLSTPHNFKVNDVVSVAGVVDTAEIISKTVENGLAILTTRFGHNFLEEEEVTISGLGEPYDGTFKIASFTDAQILYAVEVSNPEEIRALTAVPLGTGFAVGSNSVFNGEYPISAITNTTISYNRVANIVNPTAVTGAVALGASAMNGTYIVTDTPSPTKFSYEKELNNVAEVDIPLPVEAEDPKDQQPRASASVQSIHSGKRTLTSVSRNTITFTQSNILSDVPLESVSGTVTADSIFNGEFLITSSEANTFTYTLTAPSNVLETSANNLSYVRAPYIYNGTYSITAVDNEINSFSYSKVHSDRLKTTVIGYGTARVKPVAIVSSFGPFPGNSSIDIGFSTKAYSGTAITPTVYRGFELKNVGEALNAYSDSINGFEYRIDCAFDEKTKTFTKTFVLLPIDFPDPPAPGELSPISRFGADKFVFEYPGNIVNVTLDESAENSSTRFFVIGENDLGPDAGPPMGVASNTKLLDGTTGERAWPILDDDEKVDGIDDEGLLYAYAEKYLTEARPPDARLTVQVNGSLQPVVGTYAPGDWCAIIVNDTFILERMTSGLEPRDNVIVRKIDAMKISVPDGTTFPEKVDLTLVPEWEVDKRGE